MTDQFTPTTDEMRWVYVRADRAALSREEYEAEFDRWLAEVERAAAEKAWAEGYKLTPMTDNAEMVEMLNPYRKEKNGERTE